MTGAGQQQQRLLFFLAEAQNPDVVTWFMATCWRSELCLQIKKCGVWNSGPGPKIKLQPVKVLASWEVVRFPCLHIAACCTALKLCETHLCYRVSTFHLLHVGHDYRIVSVFCISKIGYKYFDIFCVCKGWNSFQHCALRKGTESGFRCADIICIQSLNPEKYAKTIQNYAVIEEYVSYFEIKG